MLVQVTSKQELDQKRQNSDYLMVVFLKSTCPPCIRLKPILEQLSEQYQTVPIVAIYDNFLGEDIKSTPTFKLYQKGKLINEFAGYQEDLVKEFLQQHYQSESLSGPYSGEIVTAEKVSAVDSFRYYLSLLYAAAATADPWIKKISEYVYDAQQYLDEDTKAELYQNLAADVETWKIINLIDPCFTNDKLYHNIRKVKGYGRINTINFMGNILLARVLELYNDDTLIYLANRFRAFITEEYRLSRTKHNLTEMISYFKILQQEIQSPAPAELKDIVKSLKDNLRGIIKNAK